MAEDTMKAVLHYARPSKRYESEIAPPAWHEQARHAGWTHEEYLAAVLSREVSAREASGPATRIRSASFPTRKSLEDYNFGHQPARNRDMINHLVTGACLAKSRNVVLAPARPTRPSGWWSMAAHNANCLPAEPAKLRRIGLLVVDEVGYIPPSPPRRASRGSGGGATWLGHSVSVAGPTPGVLTTVEDPASRDGAGSGQRRNIDGLCEVSRAANRQRLGDRGCQTLGDGLAIDVQTLFAIGTLPHTNRESGEPVYEAHNRLPRPATDCHTARGAELHDR